MLSHHRVLTIAMRVSAATLVATLLPLAACHRSAEQEAIRLTGGRPARGKEIVRPYGCVSCHTIPGVRGADALVGPPLTGIASRAYIAGVLPNTPDNMMRWIRDPQSVDSLTAMPNTGVTANDARDIAAYLYTLK
jgi:cytochrome c